MLYCSGSLQFMASSFLKLLYISLCSIWLGSIWLQLFQMTYSIFELLMELTLYHLFNIFAYTSWHDNIPIKQQWQGLMCFTSSCHWESFSQSKVCGIYFCSSVAPSGQCTGKHADWKNRMYYAMITKIPIICSESSWKQRVEHSPNPSLSCGFYSLLSFLRGNAPSFCQEYRLYWWFSNCAYQQYADLDLGFQVQLQDCYYP